MVLTSVVPCIRNSYGRLPNFHKARYTLEVGVGLCEWAKAHFFI